MAEEGGKVGEARVEIIADIVVDEESLNAAAQQVQGAMAKEANPVTERGGRTRGGKQVVDVEANVATKLTKNVHNDIQKAIDSDDFQLTIDTGNIRQQIQNALREPFTLTVTADVRGAQAVASTGVAHGPAVAAGAPLGRGRVPPELEAEMFRNVPGKGRQALAFRDAIDNVYRNINEALGAAGKGRLGTQSLQPGNQVEKLGELMDRFGDKVSDWVQTAGPINRPTGKGSVMEFLKSEGIDVKKSPEVQALVSNVGGFGGDTRRSAEIFAKHVRDWMNTNPVQAAPAAAAAEPVAQRTVSEIVKAVEKERTQAREEVQQERQRGLGFAPVDPSLLMAGGVFSGGRAPARRQANEQRPSGADIFPISDRPGVRERIDPTEAERRSRTGLGIGERANVRRLRGRGANFQGIDLEPFLRAAESGAFQDIFERFEGRESKGLFQASAGTQEGFDELARLGKRKPGVKFSIAGQEGRFAGVRPSEAFMRTFAEATGAPDAAREFLEQAAVQESVRKATAQGARPARAAIGGETKRGQGGIRQLGATGRQIAEGIEAEGRRLTKGEQAIANRAARQRVDEGVGFSPAELIDRQLESPGAQGRWGARLLQELGLEGGPETISNALLQRFMSDPNRPEGKGGTVALRRAAFGPTGKSRRTVGAGEDAGIFGELMGQVPGDLGRSSTNRIRRDLTDMLNGLIGDEGFRRRLAEEEAVRKESMSSVRGGTTSSTIAHGLTGEGQFRFAPGQRAALEADINTQTRRRGRISRLERFGAEGPFGPAAGRLLGIERSAFEDPDVLRRRLEESDARRVLEEAEARQKVSTRQATMARGKYVTGDETMRLAREMGVTMEPEPEPGLPFAAFSQKYGPNRGGPGGPGGGGRGGGGFEGITGPIHVIVDNTPLAVSWAGGSAPASRGRGRVSAEEEVVEGPMGPYHAEQATATYKPATFPKDRTIGAVERAMERDFVAALRGQNDPRARQAFEKRSFERESRYLQGTSPSPEEANFLAALQQANNPRAAQRAERTREAEQRRAARFARITNPEGLAVERDISDEEFGGVRSRLRSIQRRVPRRGFGASLTDLITSGLGGGSFERQLEAVGRAEREAAELTQLGGQRATLRSQRRDLLGQGRGLPFGDPARRAIGETVVGINRQLGGLNKAIELSMDKFNEHAREAGKASTVLKSFGAAALGSIGSTAIGALTFGAGAAITVGAGVAIANGLEKIFDDPALRGAIRTQLGEGTRAAGGRADIAFAQQAATIGLSDANRLRLAPELERASLIEAGNKALQDQVGLLKLAQETGQRGANAGIGQTLGGIFGTPINGTMPAAEQIGNLLGLGPGGGGVVRTSPRGQELMEGGGRGREFAINAALRGESLGGGPDRLVGDLDKFRERIEFINNQLSKAGQVTVKFVEGTQFARDQLDKQAAELQFAGLPQLAGLGTSGIAGITGANGELLSGQDAARLIADAIAQGSKPTVEALLKTTENERLAQVQLQDRQRDFTVGTVQPQTTAIALGQQGFGAGSPLKGGLPGVPRSEQRQFNSELTQTSKLYQQINADVAQGVDEAKQFVATTFSYDPKIGQDFAKSLDLSMGYAKQIANIQIGLETKNAAYQAAQFSYQINIAKRSLADARGLAGQLTGETKNNLGVLEREQFLLQRRAQFLQLELGQRQINFQRSIAGFTAPGLTGEERAARIQQAKIEADFAQKQLNIQKQLAGLQGRQFTIQASRAVTDLVGQLGLLERGRTLSLETTLAEKKIRALTILQEKENKKVQTFYEAAVARTSDIMTLEAQLVASTGRALVEITNDVITAFRRTYQGITDTLDNRNALGGQSSQDNSPDDRNALGMVSSTTSIGKYGVAGEAGGEAVAIIRDPKQLVTPLGGGSPNQTTIQIIVQGNKFTSEEEEDRVMRKLTQAVRDAQGRDLALRGLRTP